MVQGSFNPNITFLVKNRDRYVETKKLLVLCKENIKNANRKHRNENFGKQKKTFLSHVPRIIQPKNQVPRSKYVHCRPHTNTQTDTHESGAEDTLSGFQEIFLQTIFIKICIFCCCKFKIALDSVNIAQGTLDVNISNR